MSPESKFRYPCLWLVDLYCPKKCLLYKNAVGKILKLAFESGRKPEEVREDLLSISIEELSEFMRTRTEELSTTSKLQNCYRYRKIPNPPEATA